MSDYTHANLKDNVDDAAEGYGLAPQFEARFGRKALGLAGGGFSYQRLAPGFRVPFGHRHANHEEVYLVLSGGGRVKIEDEVRDLRQWDVLRFAPATARGWEAGPEGMELLAIGFGEGGDAELLQDFWSD
jgi:uncharacterized cupin superfamily protein